MTLTASGQISMNDINVEFGRSGTTANSSLEDLSDGTVATINTANDSGDRPDGSAPHEMTEFYSYDHSASAANASFGSFSDTTIRFIGLSPGDNVSNHAVTTSAMTDASGTAVISRAVNSGTAKGSLRVAVSNSGDPGTATNNSFAGGTSNSGSGYETLTTNNAVGSVSFSGSVTMHVRFAFLPHGSVTETTSSTITVTNNNTSDTSITLTTSVTSFGGFCVSEGVPVNCIDYYKHISELEVGDMVMSYNFDTSQVEEVEILKIEKPNHSNLVTYIFDDMEDIQYKHIESSPTNKVVTVNRGLTITKDHPMYKEDGTMVCLDTDKAQELYGLEAQEIQKGDRIRFIDSIKTVDKYLLNPGEQETYTILTKNNNFYAGGVLVHSEIGE